MNSITYFNPVELIRDFRIRLNNKQRPHREVSNGIRGQILSKKLTLLYPTDPTIASRVFSPLDQLTLLHPLPKLSQRKYLAQQGGTSYLPVSKVTLRNLWIIAFKDTLRSKFPVLLPMMSLASKI